MGSYPTFFMKLPSYYANNGKNLCDSILYFPVWRKYINCLCPNQIYRISKERIQAFSTVYIIGILQYILAFSDNSSRIHRSLMGDKVNSYIRLSYRPANHVAWHAGTTTLCRSWLYPPVRSLWIRLQGKICIINFLAFSNRTVHGRAQA